MAHFVICFIFGHFFPLSLFIPFWITWKYRPHAHAAWRNEQRRFWHYCKCFGCHQVSILNPAKEGLSCLPRTVPQGGCSGFAGVSPSPCTAGERMEGGETWVGNTAHPCPPGTSQEKVAIQKLCLLLEVKWPLSGPKWQFCLWEDYCIPALLYLLGLKLKRKWEVIFLSLQVFFSALIQPEETSRRGSSVEHHILGKPRKKHHSWSFSRQWSPTS